MSRHSPIKELKITYITLYADFCSALLSLPEMQSGRYLGRLYIHLNEQSYLDL